MSSSTVGLISPGQMGAAVAAQARRNGVQVLWCPQGRGLRTERRAADAGLTRCESMDELCSRSTVILSICPPANAADVAHQVAAFNFEGIFVEANAIDPERYKYIRSVLNRAEAVVDACIIGPPPSATKSTSLYLAGDPAILEVVAAMFNETSVLPVQVDGQPPAASALKMAYASYQKSARALAAVAHALAADYGVTRYLVAEGERSKKSPLADPDYIPSVAARAWRWEFEMRDVARALQGNQLPSGLAEATADVLARWAPDKDDSSLTTEDALRHLRVERDPTGEG